MILQRNSTTTTISSILGNRNGRQNMKLFTTSTKTATLFCLLFLCALLSPTNNHYVDAFQLQSTHINSRPITSKPSSSIQTSTTATANTSLKMTPSSGKLSELEPIFLPQARYDDIIRWTFDMLDRAPIEIKSSNIGLGNGLFLLCDDDDGNVGSDGGSCHVTKAGTTLFTISHKKCLSLPNAFHSSPALETSLKTMLEEHSEEDGPIAALSSFLASEILREHCAAWEDDVTLKGSYSPYIAGIPSGRGVSGQDHMLWWNEKEVLDYFSTRGYEDGALEKALALREWVTEEGDIIVGMLVSFLASQGMGLSVSFVRGAVTNAFVNVLTRSLFVEMEGGVAGLLGEGGEKERDLLPVLIPVLDMAQHSVTPNLYFEVDDNQDIVVKAKEDILQGEELTLDYYPCHYDQECPLEQDLDDFFVMYGFIPRSEK